MVKTKFLALLTAVCMLSAFSLTSCSGGGGGDSGSDEKRIAYTGSYTVDGASYSTLTLNGTASEGTATLSGGSGSSLSGSYSSGATGASVLSLRGTYIIRFSAGTIKVTFDGIRVTFSAGSIAASGSGSGESGQTYYAVVVRRLTSSKIEALAMKQSETSYSQVLSIRDSNNPSATKNNEYSCGIEGIWELNHPFTGDMYGLTDIRSESDVLAEAVILSPNGSGLFIKQTNLDGNGSCNAPGNCNDSITYTKSGSSVTMTWNGQAYNLTLGTDSLIWGSKTYKKL